MHVKRKQKIILEDLFIENYAAEGKSLAKLNGKVIFVEKRVPGDIADVQLYKNKKDWAEGFPLEIKRYSADRVDTFLHTFWRLRRLPVANACLITNSLNTNSSRFMMY